MTRPPSNDRRHRGRRTARTLRVEPFEPRQLLAAFVVTTTVDGGAGSLRQAIIDANTNPGADSITFEIGGEGAGVRTIALNAALPPLLDATDLDATTQPGYSGTPLIELDGTNAGARSNGLEVLAAGCSVSGLAINRFDGSGILVNSPPATEPGPVITAVGGGPLITACFIGTDATGTFPLGNAGYGILVTQGAGTRITRLGDARPNVIAANGFDGIRLTGTGVVGAEVSQNQIGTDVTGTVPLGNLGSGIDVRNGAEAATSHNLIAANGLDGVRVQDASGYRSSFDGLGGYLASSPSLGNAGSGLHLVRAVGSLVLNSEILNNGGPGVLAEGAGAGNDFASNVIANNGGGVGIRLSGGANNGQAAPTVVSAASFGASGTTVSGTVVGTPGGTVRVQLYLNPASDPAEGREFLGSTFVTPGSDGTAAFSVTVTPGIGSFLSATATDLTNGTSEFAPFQVPSPFTVVNTNDSGFGSLRQAILNANAHPNGSQPDAIDFQIPGAGPYVILVGAPLIVTDPVVIDGYTQAGSRPNTAAVGSNAAVPVVLQGNPLPGVEVGDANATALFITSGNSTVRGLTIEGFLGAGVYMIGPGGNRVEGNFIGTGPGGEAARGNALGGVLIGTSDANVIGGGGPAARNVISGNDGPGIYAFGNATRNRIDDNLIGTDATGTRALGNANIGVLISDAPGNAVVGNVISGNRAATGPVSGVDPATLGAGGVVIIGPASSGNILVNNLIGTDATGTAALPNAYDGVDVSGAPDNLIGGAGAGNTISANGGVGVRIAGAGATRNVLAGNRIGTDVTGTVALGNRFDGVFLNGAPGNSIGVPGIGNLISANGGSGVLISTAAATGNLIQSNTIGGTFGNAGWGVAFLDASGNTVGGPAGSGNVILNNRFGAFGFVARGNALPAGTVGGNVVTGNTTSTPAGPLARSASGRKFSSSPVKVHAPRRATPSRPRLIVRRGTAGAHGSLS